MYVVAKYFVDVAGKHRYAVVDTETRTIHSFKFSEQKTEEQVLEAMAAHKAVLDAEATLLEQPPE